MEVRRETLHGHTAALPMELLAGADHIDLVMIAAGGCIYDDDQWALAVLRAARQLAPADVDETEFWSVYDAQRQAQGGSLSRAVATHFLPSGDSRGAEQAREKPLPGAGRVDVSGAGRPARTPSARMWKRALEETGVQADRAVHGASCRLRAPPGASRPARRLPQSMAQVPRARRHLTESTSPRRVLRRSVAECFRGAFRNRLLLLPSAAAGGRSGRGSRSGQLRGTARRPSPESSPR
jgi:hypothetical protein